MFSLRLKRLSYFHKAQGLSWRAVFLLLVEQYNYKGSYAEFERWRKSKDSENTRLDMLCAIDSWADVGE